MFASYVSLSGLLTFEHFKAISVIKSKSTAILFFYFEHVFSNVKYFMYVINIKFCLFWVNFSPFLYSLLQ